MSEIISNENKLSMLINDTMEAMAEVSSCKSKASCISLDAGPLQRGTCAGFLGYPSDPVSDGLESTTGEGDQKALDNDQDTAVKICFSAAGLGGVRTSWDAVLWQDRLYVSVTASQLADGSKRAFVSLLEYAEEELGVSDVVACLDRLHHDNKNVIRNFLFLGFQPLAPGHEFHPSNPNVVCFLYTI